MRLHRHFPFTMIALSVLTCFVSAADITKESLSEIKSKIDDEAAVLVDVREKREWDQGHVEGAIFLPLSKVQDGLTEAELMELPKDKVLYTHCVVGKRAVTAGTIPEKKGVKGGGAQHQ